MSVYKAPRGPARDMSGLFEDLQLLSERLDALWDMYDTSLSIERPREERQAMVVEAPHSTLWPLRLPAGLRFMPPIPEMHLSLIHI